MDASPHLLAETVRAKRTAVDNDLEMIRVRIQQADPRQRIDPRRVARTALPIVGVAAAVALWARRRRSVLSLEQLLVHGLRDLYEAEEMLLPALDRMMEQATNPELQRAFAAHRAETEGHLERLSRVFRSMGARRAHGKGTAGVAGIVEEAERMMKGRIEPHVRDACLIAAAQRIEHVEIATYGTLAAYAETLGFTYAAELLQQTLEEEEATDEKLTHIATRFIHPQTIRSA